jgi:hypothetical protein
MVMHQDSNPQTPKPEPQELPFPDHSMELYDIFPTDMLELDVPKTASQVYATATASATASFAQPSIFAQ